MTLLRALALLCLVALVGCGADGVPTAPGMTVTGSASLGIARDGG